MRWSRPSQQIHYCVALADRLHQIRMQRRLCYPFYWIMSRTDTGISNLARRDAFPLNSNAPTVIIFCHVSTIIYVITFTHALEIGKIGICWLYNTIHIYIFFCFDQTIQTSCNFFCFLSSNIFQVLMLTFFFHKNFRLLINGSNILVFWKPK